MRPSRAACGGDRCRFFRPPRECGSRNASSPRASRDGCRRASRSRKYRHRFSSGPRRRIPIRRAASRTLHGTPPFSPPPFAGTAAPPARRANRVPRRTPQPPNPASAAVSPPYRAASRQRTGCRPRHEPLRSRTPTPRGIANRAANTSASARHAANEDTRKVAAHASAAVSPPHRAASGSGQDADLGTSLFAAARPHRGVSQTGLRTGVQAHGMPQTKTHAKSQPHAARQAA